MKIAKCRTCGRKMSQVWNERTNCDGCGAPVDQVEVDMGFADRIPRVLNIGGIAFMVFAVLYIFYKLIDGDLGRDAGIDIMILFFAGIIFFAASLAAQFQISNRAKEKQIIQTEGRKQRKVRSSKEIEKGAVKTGKIEPPRRRTASKVPIRKK